MIQFTPIRHRVVSRFRTGRLCDGQPGTEADIDTYDLQELRAAREQATLCPQCQDNSGYRPLHLRLERYKRTGPRSLAHLYTVPVQYDFDEIRNCARCRRDPDDHNCRHWEEARKGVRVLYQEARRVSRNVTDLLEHTGGLPANLYQFVDGSMAYFAYGAPSWQEADELTGSALRQAKDITQRQGTPGGKADWNHPEDRGETTQ